MTAVQVPTIGEIMESASRERVVSALMIAIAAVYTGGILVASVFNFQLITSHLSGALRLFAAAGVLLVSFSALLYPIAYHYWTAPGWHRIACLAFYAVDLFILSANAVGEFNLLASGSAPDWLGGWLQLAPATLLFPPVAWSVLWHMDPRNQATDAVYGLRTATLEALSKQMRAVTRSSEHLNQHVLDGANQLAASVIADVVRDSHSLAPTRELAIRSSNNGHASKLEVRELKKT